MLVCEDKDAKLTLLKYTVYMVPQIHILLCVVCSIENAVTNVLHYRTRLLHIKGGEVKYKADA